MGTRKQNLSKLIFIPVTIHRTASQRQHTNEKKKKDKPEKVLFIF